MTTTLSSTMKSPPSSSSLTAVLVGNEGGEKRVENKVQNNSSHRHQLHDDSSSGKLRGYKGVVVVGYCGSIRFLFLVCTIIIFYVTGILKEKVRNWSRKYLSPCLCSPFLGRCMYALA